MQISYYIFSLEAVEPTDPKPKVRPNAMWASCETSTDTSAGITMFAVEEWHPSLVGVVFVTCALLDEWV